MEGTATALANIPLMAYIRARMAWNVEHTNEFGEWFGILSESQQDDVAAVVLLLMEQGPHLPFPYSSGIAGSKHSHMRELRVQSGGPPIPLFYSFYPRRPTLPLPRPPKTADHPLVPRHIPT